MKLHLDTAAAGPERGDTQPLAAVNLSAWESFDVSADEATHGPDGSTALWLTGDGETVMLTLPPGGLGHIFGAVGDALQRLPALRALQPLPALREEARSLAEAHNAAPGYKRNL